MIYYISTIIGRFKLSLPNRTKSFNFLNFYKLYSKLYWMKFWSVTTREEGSKKRKEGRKIRGTVVSESKYTKPEFNPYYLNS